MVTRSDAASLSELISIHGAENVRLRLHLDSRPFHLDTAVMGNLNYPKVRVRQRLIHFLGSHGWGIALTFINGAEDWQLFIMANGSLDDDSLNSWELIRVIKQKDSNSDFDSQKFQGLLVTVPVAGTTSRMKMYTQYISQQCPIELSVLGSQLYTLQ